MEAGDDCGNAGMKRQREPLSDSEDNIVSVAEVDGGQKRRRLEASGQENRGPGPSSPRRSAERDTKPDTPIVPSVRSRVQLLTQRSDGASGAQRCLSDPGTIGSSGVGRGGAGREHLLGEGEFHQRVERFRACAPQASLTPTRSPPSSCPPSRSGFVSDIQQKLRCSNTPSSKHASLLRQEREQELNQLPFQPISENAWLKRSSSDSSLTQVHGDAEMEDGSFSEAATSDAQKPSAVMMGENASAQLESSRRAQELTGDAAAEKAHSAPVLDAEDWPGSDSPGLDPPGLDPPGLDSPGLDPPGSDSPGLDPPGSEPPGLDPPGLDPPGLDPPGSDSPGLDPPGSEPPGLDPPGLDPPGSDSPGSDPADHQTVLTLSFGEDVPELRVAAQQRFFQSTLLDESDVKDTSGFSRVSGPDVSDVFTFDEDEGLLDESSYGEEELEPSTDEEFKMWRYPGGMARNCEEPEPSGPDGPARVQDGEYLPPVHVSAEVSGLPEKQEDEETRAEEEECLSHSCSDDSGREKSAFEGEERKPESEGSSEGTLLDVSTPPQEQNRVDGRPDNYHALELSDKCQTVEVDDGTAALTEAQSFSHERINLSETVQAASSDSEIPDAAQSPGEMTAAEAQEMQQDVREDDAAQSPGETTAAEAQEMQQDVREDDAAQSPGETTAAEAQEMQQDVREDDAAQSPGETTAAEAQEMQQDVREDDAAQSPGETQQDVREDDAAQSPGETQQDIREDDAAQSPGEMTAAEAQEMQQDVREDDEAVEGRRSSKKVSFILQPELINSSTLSEIDTSVESRAETSLSDAGSSSHDDTNTAEFIEQMFEEVLEYAGKVEEERRANEDAEDRDSGIGACSGGLDQTEEEEGPEAREEECDVDKGPESSGEELLTFPASGILSPLSKSVEAVVTPLRLAAAASLLVTPEETRPVPAGSAESAPLYSIDAYRTQRQSQLPSMQSVTPAVHRRAPETATPRSSINSKDKIAALNEDAGKLQTVISQTLQALSCCTDEDHGQGSMEEAEAEKLLLVSCEKRSALLAEAARLREESSSEGKQEDADYVSQQPCRGTVRISSIQLPLKVEYVCASHSRTGRPSHYFFVLIRYGPCNMVATPLATAADAQHGDAISFPTSVTLKDIRSCFEIDVEVYSLSHTAGSSSSADRTSTTTKSRVTPRKLLNTLTRASSSLIGSAPATASPRRSSHFCLVGSHKITLASLGQSKFPLDKMKFEGKIRRLLGDEFQEKVPFLSPLEGHIYLHLDSEGHSAVHQHGFLTMFQVVGGFGVWHRRYFVLEGCTLSYWNHPNDRETKEAEGSLSLSRCPGQGVRPVTRDLCARPFTFELVSDVTQQQDRSQDASSRCWFSADTKQDQLDWMEKLNQALLDFHTWSQILSQSEGLQPDTSSRGG